VFLKKSFLVLGAVGIVFALFMLWAVSVNNTLIAKEESIKGAWSQVENVYQRRADLIPNLVNTVKGYATHEKETLEAVIQARAAAIGSGAAVAGGANPEALKKFQAAQDGLSSALSRLMVVVERYPDLKANTNFRDLQAQLEGTENRIAVERRRFNEAVQDFNTSIRLFPASFIAGVRGFTAKGYFEAQAGAEKAPEVKF
jgi:LemA protein